MAALELQGSRRRPVGISITNSPNALSAPRLHRATGRTLWCLIGSIAALILLSKLHDKYLERIGV
jgi:hypothetical protein